MLPSIFGENLFDDFFNDPFGMMNVSEGHNPLYGKHAKNLMKTDIREKENSYELAVDLPGFKKDEISIDLSNGYLTIEAAKGLDKDEEDKKGRYIRRERYTGSMSRSFYVGDVCRNRGAFFYFSPRISVRRTGMRLISAISGGRSSASSTGRSRYMLHTGKCSSLSIPHASSTSRGLCRT